MWFRKKGKFFPRTEPMLPSQEVIKSKSTLRWERDITWAVESINAHRFSNGKVEEERPIPWLVVDNMVLKFILEKRGWKDFEFMKLLKMWSGRRIMWTLQWIFGLHEREIFCCYELLKSATCFQIIIYTPMIILYCHAMLYKSSLEKRLLIPYEQSYVLSEYFTLSYKIFPLFFSVHFPQTPSFRTDAEWVCVVIPRPQAIGGNYSCPLVDWGCCVAKNKRFLCQRNFKFINKQ